MADEGTKNRAAYTDGVSNSKIQTHEKRKENELWALVSWKINGL